MKWKSQIQNLKAYQPGKTMDDVKELFNLEKVVKLASNENPFGCSRNVETYLKNNALSHALYPDGYAKELRFKVAEHLSVEPGQLLFGNGSDEVIEIISRALLDGGKSTVMATPTFPQYKHNAIVEGAEVREVPLDAEGKHQLVKMLGEIDDTTSVVWLCSPNNPTGEYIRNGELISFLDAVPSHVLVVLDEAYFEYVVADDYYNSLELLKSYPQLLITRTFSKAYGLAGFRVGFGIGNKDVIGKLDPIREPFNNNTLAQGAASAAIEDQAFIEECRRENRKGLEQYYRFCEENGLAYVPSQANFVLIDFGVSGDEVFQYLMSKGYIVRSGEALGYPHSVRITVGSHDQNEEVIEKMMEFLALQKQA
ncbi:histidinol-phosphate transaminase [Rossellomorea vietnamensis]|uniref:histidinol-phosphate transaminase n=1 Tax=Rossellomorea vietnamensis TaxID=218284 RepID=UPI001CC9ACCE|nr:histidinol-phosphate transaminase [Rossellomorea vietnamensis]MCA0147817.1 histidinol-phosphate transaminase [Rossellomorea vietnamensis]